MENTKDQLNNREEAVPQEPTSQNTPTQNQPQSSSQQTPPQQNSQDAEKDENKMPMLMKLIIAYFVFLIFKTLSDIGDVPATLRDSSLLGIDYTAWHYITHILGIVVALLFIAGILLRRWRKPMLSLLPPFLFIWFAQIAWLLSMPLNELAAKTGRENYELPELQNLSPETVEILMKVIMGTFMSLGIIIGILIFIYVYKHKEYFREKV